MRTLNGRLLSLELPAAEPATPCGLVPAAGGPSPSCDGALESVCVLVDGAGRIGCGVGFEDDAGAR